MKTYRSHISALFCSCLGISVLALTQCSDSLIDQNPQYKTVVSKEVHQLSGHLPNDELSWDLIKWNDDKSIKGPISIVVNKPKQMLYVYRGDTLVGHCPISSGKRAGMTPTGTFNIQQKERHHKSYYGSFVSRTTGATVNGDADIRRHSVPSGARFVPASMPYFMRVTGAVGIHQGYLPGYPASHGCIRIPEYVASKLYQVAGVGTKVHITNDENYKPKVSKKVEKSDKGDKSNNADKDGKKDKEILVSSEKPKTDEIIPNDTPVHENETAEN